MDVILLFVFKTSSFYSLNSQYLEIFEFVRINFMCFAIRYSFKFIQYCINKAVFSYFADYTKKKILGQILQYITTLTFFLKQCCLIKLFFAVFSIVNVIGFQKSVEFEFEFSLRIPVIC